MAASPSLSDLGDRAVASVVVGEGGQQVVCLERPEPERKGPAHLPVLQHQVGVAEQRVGVPVVQARELGVVVVPLDL